MTACLQKTSGQVTQARMKEWPITAGTTNLRTSLMADRWLHARAGSKMYDSYLQ